MQISKRIIFIPFATLAIYVLGIASWSVFKTPKCGSFIDIASSPMPKPVKETLVFLNIDGTVDYEIRGIFRRQYIVYATCDTEAVLDRILIRWKGNVIVRGPLFETSVIKRQFPRSQPNPSQDEQLFARPGDRVIFTGNSGARVMINENTGECEIRYNSSN